MVPNVIEKEYFTFTNFNKHEKYISMACYFVRSFCGL